jgi:hypothetical protein
MYTYSSVPSKEWERERNGIVKRLAATKSPIQRYSYKFMECKGALLFWPSNKERNTTWVPFEHVLCLVGSIENGGRQYRLHVI